MSFSYQQGGNQHILYDAEIIPQIESSFFEPSTWQERDKITGRASGRATVFFISDGPRHFVLRHYRRGGFAAKFIKDQYFWCGVQRSRAFREWHLLDWMFRQQLPVPRPLAARVIKTGFYYTADLITETLPETYSLASLLLRDALSDQILIRVGQCIRRFHDHHIFHADLNAHNILLNKNDEVFLIDFDQGSKKEGGGAWKQNNLARLKRSFLKLKTNGVGETEAEKQWQVLLEGYQ